MIDNANAHWNCAGRNRTLFWAFQDCRDAIGLLTSSAPKRSGRNRVIPSHLLLYIGQYTYGAQSSPFRVQNNLKISAMKSVQLLCFEFPAPSIYFSDAYFKVYGTDYHHFEFGGLSPTSMLANVWKELGAQNVKLTSHSGLPISGTFRPTANTVLLLLFLAIKPSEGHWAWCMLM